MMKKRSSESVSKKNQSQVIPRKDSKSSEFDQLLKSGETILLSLNPLEKNAHKPIPEEDGLDKIMTAMQNTGAPKEFDGQRATLSRSASKEPDNFMGAENKRLESRIQQLNSDLFKERAANAELSDQVKSLLFQLEGIKRRSIHLEGEEADNDTLEESPEAVLASIEDVELNAAPAPTPTPAASRPSVASNSDEVWAAKYSELEQKCNLLAKRAVQTIQNTKIEVLELQQDNLELQDKIRELQEDLQKRDEEKAKSMSLIPRLIEVIRKLQTELAEEKQKRELESEFDALHLQVSRKE